MTRKSKDPRIGYFGRAIPELLEVIEEGKLTPIQVLSEFKRQLDLRSA